MTDNSISSDWLKDLEVEFLHGVPVKLPPETIATITQHIEQVVASRLQNLLPDYEEYSDFEHGSHAEGWNDCINEIKALTSKAGGTE